MIKVLVVEDSLVARELLVHILDSDPGIEVIGTAGDGLAALEFLAHSQPDVVTMDIHMPRLDGFEATRRIMETRPVPIVMVSASVNSSELALTFQALEAGAVDAVAKPHGPGHPDHNAVAARLVQTVKAMSEVKVIKRWARMRPEAKAEVPKAEAPIAPKPAVAEVKIVAIGASTGGPPVLETILSDLPKAFPVPILITQHIAAGFSQGMADWLAQTTGFPICMGTSGAWLQPGHAYLAPDNHHMGVDKGGHIVLCADAPENGLRPAVSYLFRSVAAAFGAGAVGVLLTGMGRDGAAELGVMRAGGAVTIAQDKESSVVHGMPGEAINLGAAIYVLPPKRIAALLTSLALKRS